MSIYAEPRQSAAKISARWQPAFGLRVLMGAGVGLLFAACFPPFHLEVLLPVAIACLLLLIDGMTPRLATYIGLACGIVFFGSCLHWLSGMFGAAAFSLWAIAGAYPAFFCALWVRLRARLPQVPIWLLTAVVWTGVEVLRSEVMPPSFSWLGLGYALVDSPVAVAPAAWFGSYGLTFGIAALGALLATARQHPRVAWVAMLAWIALCLLPLPTPVPSRPLQVRLVQAASEDDESLFRLSPSGPGSKKADIIVWPEYSYVSDPTSNHKLWAQLTQLPQREQCYFLFGAKEVLDPNDMRAYRNTAFLLDPSGRIIGKHVKNHLVPFFNDGRPGTKADAFQTAIGRLGVGTCFDMDFPDVARRLTASGAEVLLVPSDNPREWGDLQHIQHVQMFQMRAVECGRWLATADVAGSTYVVAPTGRVMQRVSTRGAVVLNASVGRQQGRTLFVLGVWLFGPCCLIALGILFIGSFRQPSPPSARRAAVERRNVQS